MATTNIRKDKQLVSIDELRETFVIIGGQVCWRYARWNGRIQPGQLAGYPNKAGYYDISLNNVRFYAHRIAFALHHGQWPEELVDHIDGNPANNDPANLRQVSDSQNNYNMRKRQDNSTGVVGITAHSGGWAAEINAECSRYRKWFKDQAEAIAWREQKVKELFGNYAHPNK